MGIPDHLTCLLRNPYAGQEGSFLTLYGTLIGSILRKETGLSAVTLFVYAEHIKRKAGWITSWDQDSQEKHQQPQICRWEEELKNLLMRVKEENERAGLRLNIKANKLRLWHPAPFRSDQIRSVAQSCPTLCDPMNRSTPGLPVHHQLPEFTQTHVHGVSDAIQPSHPPEPLLHGK